MKLFARGNETLAQVLGKWCRIPSRGLETPLLAHSISINGRLVFEVERDRAEYLGERQSFEFSQDRFGGEPFVEALDDGIERYACTGQVVPAVALFHVFFRHQPNYSGVPFLPGMPSAIGVGGSARADYKSKFGRSLIGWKDPYSPAAFSQRQNAYGQRFHPGSVYTPQMVVNGVAEFVGNDSREANRKIAAAGAQTAPVPVRLFVVSPGIARVEIDKAPDGMTGGVADVMVAVASNETGTQVLSGENGGRKLHHVAVVRTMKVVGEIRDGRFFSTEIDLGKNSRDLRIVAWIQERGQGRVLGAAMRSMAVTSGPRAAK
jgi:hypothetical protein